ncbi:protein Niban 1 [Nothobranchius furzeri]|uniref:Family with sequence similarity 129 member A n=2 Tax=Nothobranchius furzeri TaxID=105023 RepID=A0A8C6PMP2_NOTFU|nr:protein Niban 1 [Nothobranchius furzeri]KAF7222819.1 family with sequence similarity 129 member A [Nothobranchius furzeri]
MGASSSGLLDEAKISQIKGLVEKTFSSFSVFYRQQYSVTYLGHIRQEVEPKKEGRGLLLRHRPKYDADQVLYQGTVKVSCWDEQGKKCRERYVVLRKDYRVEIHDNMETFSHGAAAKLVLQPARGIVFTSEEESRAQLETNCAGILSGVKEDSFSVASSPDGFAVYLHLSYSGYTCFMFQKEEERDHFLSGLETCIRHCNLDPWKDPSHESQAYAQALHFYRQDKGCYESWEMLLGTEEQALASQVMEEVLPWLQNQLQSKLKGKKNERIRQWLATVQATHMLVLEQLTAGLEALKEECRQAASASQTLIRSNLDQIISSHDFLENKVRACICEEAEEVCGESIVPYMSSILEALTEHIGDGILGMQHTLQTQMSSAFSLTNGKAEGTTKVCVLQVLSSLHSISLDRNYKRVESLAKKLEDLKQRFGMGSVQRLVHAAHLEMEQLLDSAVYTLEQFLQSSSKLQPSQVPVKMERAKERVLKQLDYDSRVVKRRLYQEALLEITLPSLVRRMDSKWKTELQQFEQYIFSDYSSFILVHNVYDDVLRSILRKEIQTVVQDAASKNSNNHLLDMADLTISQYSLLGQTPPRSAPDSPAVHSQRSSSVPGEDQETTTGVEEGRKTPEVSPQTDAEVKDETRFDVGSSPCSDQSSLIQSPTIIVTQQFDENAETSEEAKNGGDAQTSSDMTADRSSKSDGALTQEVDTTKSQAEPEFQIPKTPDLAPVVSLQSSANIQAECTRSGDSTSSENPATPDLSTTNQTSEEPSSPGTEGPKKITLCCLSDAIAPSSAEPAVMQTPIQQPTDRAVYLTGQIKDNWEMEKAREEKRNEAAEKEMTEEERDGEAQTDESINETGGGMNGEVQKEGQVEAATEEDKSEEKENKYPEKREDLQGPKPDASEPESNPEAPVDSVGIIRDLVTEVTEVEEIITPKPPATPSA